MNQYYLLRKISVIHAIKCGKTQLFDKAIESFNRLSELKELLVTIEDNEFDDVSKQIDEWATSNPVVAENEINQMINR